MGLGNKDVVRRPVAISKGYTFAQLEEVGLAGGDTVRTEVMGMNRGFMQVLQEVEAGMPAEEPKRKLGDLGPEDAWLYTVS